MNKNLKLSVVLLAVLGMTACKEEPKPEVLGCTYPEAQEKLAPGWICDEPIAGVELSAVGYSQKSAAGHGFMKQIAAADARVQLAQSFKSHVSNMVKLYAETTGSASSETVDQVNTSVSKIITSETLVGSRIFRSKSSPSGGLYVLVGLDSQRVQDAAEESLKTSMKNDKALWQQFKAKKAQDELAKDIANMRNR